MADNVTKPFEMEDDASEDEATEGGLIKIKISQHQAFDQTKYDISDRSHLVEKREPVRSTLEMVKYLESEETADIEAKVICRESDGKHSLRRMGKADFLRHFKSGMKQTSFYEAIAPFKEDDVVAAGPGPVLGQDFVPLLSGPFYKQLYYHDYLRMHSLAFHAYHHDPIAKRIIDCFCEFVLGKGYAIDFEDEADQAMWEAFSEANDFDAKFFNIYREYILYGEQMLWWLPDMSTYIGYRLSPAQQPAKGAIPRLRQIDPSVIWEIVTYPEDITRVLYYQWVAPTQYQIYTGRDDGETVPSTKFIWQQIPAKEIMHFKRNCVSDEKRGRSILFAVLGDLKRLRDTIDYSIAGLQKACAWSIDTTVEGSQADLDKYIRAQQALGSTAPAGSEFAHTKKITREYLGNSHTGSGSGDNKAFEWVLSKICAGVGVPINYLGVHVGNASTRSSAMVQTEPVTKTFETHQQECERMIVKIARHIGIKGGMEVTFPELVSQDRSAKIKDIITSERSGYFSKERAATMTAKEMGVTEYDFNQEQQDIQAEGPPDLGMLTLPGATGAPPAPGGEEKPLPEVPELDKTQKPEATPGSGNSQQDRRAVSMRRG